MQDAEWTIGQGAKRNAGQEVKLAAVRSVKWTAAKDAKWASGQKVKRNAGQDAKWAAER
ncbi:MAG: hypothetical protein ACRBCL_09225 [Maritimibacter sp.]